MCGRFTQTFEWNLAARLLGFSGVPPDPRPRYNVAPGRDVAVVRCDRNDRDLAMLRWGFVPGWAAWAANPDAGPRPVNARTETATTRPLLRGASASCRCPV